MNRIYEYNRKQAFAIVHCNENPIVFFVFFSFRYPRLENANGKENSRKL